FQKRCTEVALEGKALGRAVRSASRVADEVELDEAGRGLFCQVRVEGDRRIVALLNSSTTESRNNVSVSVQGRGPVTELDCLTGEAISRVMADERERISWK